MQLEVGKRYVTRGGRTTSALKRARGDEEFTFIGTLGDDRGSDSWRLDGSWALTGDSRDVFDLVAEHVESPRIQESASTAQSPVDAAPLAGVASSAAEQPENAAVDTSNPKDAFGLKKPPLRLIPAAAKLYCARVFGLGAKKYGPFNWRGKAVRMTVYLEAAERHIMAKLDGQDLDPESGQPHEAHAMACMAILLDAMATGNLIDDRPPAGAAARLIAELTET